MNDESGIVPTSAFSSDSTPGRSTLVPDRTLVHCCRFQAVGELAQTPAFTHVWGEPGEHDRLSFAQLDARACAIAVEIQQRQGVGKPVLIVLDPGADYAASLFGCLYAGAIAVPIYPPQMLRLQHTLPRLEAVIANAGAELMLSDRATIGGTLSPLWRMPHSGAIAVDEIDIAVADRWNGRMPQPDDIAILQYTSGSTGNPRGVVLTHRTLLNNLSAIEKHIHFPGACAVQWVPPYHDMGLIGGILLPITCGVEAVILSPIDFVRNPLLWLRCIDHYNGSSNGAPNFGYELCVRRIEHADCVGLDLSSWRVAVVGAEPVRASTLRRFEEKFARYGFQPTTFNPAFGMAETTVMATGSRLGQRYKTFHVDTRSLQLGKIQTVDVSTIDVGDSVSTQELVSSGTPVADMHYEIVDPQTCLKLPDGQIGEIWIRGGSVASGYWNEPIATENTFHARLADEANEKGAAEYLRTGDLAARVEGELIVTGRLKELIIVAGRNFYPHDIEQIVQSLSEAFKPDTGTALSIEIDDSEQMVVIQELQRPRKFPAEPLLHEIVAAIAEHAQVTPYAVVLVRSGSLPKTSSGKLRRTDTKEMFLRGELVELGRWQSTGIQSLSAPCFEPPVTATEKQIADIWSHVLDVDAIGRQADFFQLGGGSLLIADMLVSVGEAFATSIPMTAVFQHPQLHEFSAIVDALADNGSSLPVLRRSDAPDSSSHPLSFAQQRFWLLDQLGQTGAFLHVPISIELDRPIAREQLQRVIDRLLTRHPTLRTRFSESDQDAFQSIAETATVELQNFDHSIADRAAFSAAWQSFVEMPFELHHPPLLRVALTQTADGGCRIDVVLHHLVCDANSLQILMNELQHDFEGAFSADWVANEPLADSSLRYVDFAAWDRQPERASLIQTRLDYWTERLAGMPTELNLPRYNWQTPIDQREAEMPVVACLPMSITDAIARTAKSQNLTPAMVYLTAFQCVLARYSDTSDFGITIPTSTRPATGLQDIVGCFVNPVIYRARVDQQQTLAIALANTRDGLLSDLEHADVPFQNVVASLGGVRDTLRMPLSQVMFLYQPELTLITHLGGAQVRSVKTDYSAVTAYEISLIIESGSQTRMTLVVGDQISVDLGQRIMASLQSVLAQMAVDTQRDLTIAALSIPASAELALLESTSLGKTLAEDDNQNLLNRLREHVAQQPDQIVIKDDNHSLSYRELDERSDQISAALIEAGVRSESLIAVEMPRSIDTVVAIFGIWKAGAAYVPLDESLPVLRREQILADAKPAGILNQQRFDAMLATAKESPRMLPSLDSTALAYVIYTSGSTGKPKGVAITHRSVSNLLASFADEPGFTADDSMLAVTTLSFDISVLELFLPIWCGGQVCLTAHRIGDDPDAVIAVIASRRPTVIQSTPSAFRMLLSANWQPAPATRLLCGGEPLLPDLAADLLATGGELWNVYGPTETTVWSTIKRIEATEKINIGRPIVNTICRVVDVHGLVSPIGVAGELHVGGLGVAQGYWEDDRQTRERFFDASAGSVAKSERFYKTGDQVRRLPNGDLEFLARNDRQIKLRGFRVELDEIESALQQCDGVDRAAVVLSGDDQVANRSLIAFCSGAGDANKTSQQLVDRLPEYMIPATIAWLDTLPRTPAGKTDYKSLPVGSLTHNIQHNSSAPPQTPLEIALATAWCEVLGCQTVGRHDHFFDLGGNSLLAAQLFARLRQRFDVKLPLREVYSRPTIASLAEAIVLHQAETDADDLSDMLGQLDSLSDDEVMRALDGTNES